MNGWDRPTIHLAEPLLADVAFVAEHWEDLLESRRIGTSRPWRQALLDPDERARRLERDRLEREVRDPDAPGFTSAPEHLDVLDVIVQAWTVLDDLADLVDPGWRRLGTPGNLNRAAAEQHAPAPVTDIDPLIDRIRARLSDIIDQLDDRRLTRTSHGLTSARNEISRVLALVQAGQLLTGALCPWCKGVTPKHPEGGATTMRVEELPGSGTRKLAPLPVVVCWNPLCDPPTNCVAIRMKGRPAWSHGEWEWLAKQLIVADPPRSIAPPPAPRPDGFSDVPVEPIERFGISGVSRTAPPAHRESTAVDGTWPDTPPLPEPVLFVGGPFAGQRRRFTRLERILAAAQPRHPDGTRAGRIRLTAPDTADGDVLGAYRYQVVNDQPAYVWTAA